MGYREDSLFASSTPGVVQDDITIFNWTGTNITSMTPTRVDTATANTASGGVTFNATDSVAAANMQVAIRALGGIYADATVVAGATADNMVITVKGGYDITWAQAGGVGTFTEAGAAGSDTAVVGSVTYTKTMGGRFPRPKKIVIKGWIDENTEVSVIDEDNKAVFGTVAAPIDVDTNNAGVDAPYVRLLTADGVAGEDGAAAANTSGGVFSGPLQVRVVASAPAAARGLAPRVSLVFAEPSARSGRILKRSSGARTTQTGTFNLGVPIGNIKRIRIASSADTTVAPTLTDADGLAIYVKASTDFTTPVLEQLSHDGVDQANNAVADLLDVIAKSPITISGTLQGSGTMTYTLWVEA